jgi:hypothetical protein
MKFLTVSDLTGTQLFNLQNFAILTSTDNNLSNLCSSPLSLSAGDWLLKKVVSTEHKYNLGEVT